MREIKIKALSLVNFKGVRSLDLTFSDHDTMVCGENGTGKTTVFDAFTWLMFGKDSTGRSDSNFNIKTLDSDGNPILRLEHSVSAVICVDGKDVKLQRKYVENWVKPRGTTEETLQNHKTEFYVNDVKLGTKKEYEAEINEIINEDVFRMITNPFYFTSLNADTQKQMLLDMAGNVTNEDLAAIKPEFVEFLAELAGRPLIKYAKEISAKKKACKDELAVIPSQISIANKLMPEEENWSALEAEIKDKQKEMDSIDASISDKSKLNEQEYQKKAKIQRAIGDKRLELANRQNEVRANASQERNAAIQEIKNLEFQIQGKQREIQYKQQTSQSLTDKISKLSADLQAKRGEYTQRFKEEITFDENQFVCPTCGRPFELEDVEKKQAELTANFNQRKAEDLKRIQAEGKDMGANLKQYQEQKSKCDSEIQALTADEAKMSEQLKALQANIPEAQNVDDLLAKDQTVITIKNEITELENQATYEAKPVDVSDLREKKRVLNDAVQALYKRIAKRDQRDRAEKEIKELEEKLDKNNQELADLEKWEYTALAFQKAKDEELLKRINGLFQMVSFSFVSSQLNGGEKLTCVCTVNGTPYPDVNNAGKINAGLDIINAICNSKGVTAPIFVDNAESVNQILTTMSQKVLLYVSQDPKLTVKQ